ncbi:isocitrate lyase/phosphoenolpyruvate mutase family protein [Salinibacterium sp. SYSU T00001]|uniref:isocitrate lyase/PEP mutase family protein n=1 Tax=Homoserinimonas sedimenticola TaxID=2986805 RepID=UPI00223562E8|nr:isocitrate lyase/phosphoenolpyruvate mutase family protein [Salinibacterium sedimenticola]MCW4385614.1 isocitrate lyase/phosphoenolpyruvate mutase family protein [Salinibacterium sedimenticola]
MTNPTFVKAELLRSLHVPGSPLIVPNVWDAVTARIVAQVEGVKALATASHSISYAHGVRDGEGLTVDQAVEAASRIIAATELPVSVDFEKGYSETPKGVEENVARLIEAGAAGINIEDSIGEAKAPQFEIGDAAKRVAAARAAANVSGIPIVINARVDTLATKGGNWEEAIQRANTYLDSGADVIFMLGLNDEDSIKRALDEINGPISVIGKPGGVPLKTLAQLGVSRVSFGPGTLGLTLAHLASAASALVDLAAYPDELAFEY